MKQSLDSFRAEAGVLQGMFTLLGGRQRHPGRKALQVNEHTVKRALTQASRKVGARLARHFRKGVCACTANAVEVARGLPFPRVRPQVQKKEAVCAVTILRARERVHGLKQRPRGCHRASRVLHRFPTLSQRSHDIHFFV